MIYDHHVLARDHLERIISFSTSTDLDIYLSRVSCLFSIDLFGFLETLSMAELSWLK